MKIRQFVFKREPTIGSRSHIVSIVTDDELDVFQRAFEIGFPKEEAEKIAKWAARAQEGSKRRGAELILSGGILSHVSVECRDPGPNWTAVVKRPARGKKGRTA